MGVGINRSGLNQFRTIFDLNYNNGMIYQSELVYTFAQIL